MTRGVVLLALLVLPAGASASTITVTGTGNLQADNGVCSFAEAIEAANTNIASGNLAGECVAGSAFPTLDQIHFSLAGAGPHVISPSAVLPTIEGPVTVDGSTEPDEVRIDGTDSIATGLDVAGQDVTIDELTVVNFTTAGIDLSDSSNATVRDSFIGTDPASSAGMGNGDGVRGGFDDLITIGATIRDNLISGNTTEGISLGGGTSETEITGNLIGTDSAGNAALANGQEGIEIFDADEVTVGGDEAGDANVISGNTTSGLRLASFSPDRATDNAVLGNRIGTRIAGENALANGAGIGIDGAVDGTEIRANQISGNTGIGVHVSSGSVPDGTPSATDTTVAGNLIGSDDDGDEPLGNGTYNVFVAQVGDRAVAGTVVGGTTGLTTGGACTGDCNVIAASGNVGAALSGVGDAAILGNHIGVTQDGESSIGNDGDGAQLFDVSGARLGEPGAGNVIAGNGGDGAFVLGNEAGSANGNLIQANSIGVSSDGDTALGNTQSGVLIGGFATRTLVGGTGVGEGNVIANNGFEGVTISEDATDNAILSNSIYGNDDRGIDVGNDIEDTNDDDDLDVGANDGQNFPTMEFAADHEPTEGTAAGLLDAAPSSPYLIEVFINDTGDPVGRGQGEQWVASFEVTTDEQGIAHFSEPTIQLEIGADEMLDDVSATATELGPQGEPLSTSEFSPHVETRGCEVPATSGDDVLTGTGPADDVVCGLGGADVFTPDGGGDLFIGGAGTDEIDYEAAADGIDADLETGFIGGLGSAGDFVTEVENLIGSNFDDLILGSGLDNFVQANDGRDTIEGLDGDDTLKGGVGGDTIKGGDGADELLSQDGGDVLKGQSGADDDLSAGPGKDSLNGGGGNSDHCNGGGNDDDTPARGCESTSSIP